MSVKLWKAEFAEPLRFELRRRIKQRSVIVLWAVDPSALPPIADIRQCRWDVRFVPKADMAPGLWLTALRVFSHRLDFLVNSFATWSMVKLAGS